MLSECPDCRIGFGPSHRMCPHCGEFEANIEDRLGYLIQKAEAMLEEGTPTFAIRDLLIGERLSQELATAMCVACDSNLKRQARTIGLKRVVIGVIFFAVGICLLTFPAVLIGLYLLQLGGRNLIAGREEIPLE